MANGFSFRLQDRGEHGHLALVDARNKLMAAARQSPILVPQSVRAEGLEDAPQLRLDIDRDAANAQGVSCSHQLGTVYGCRLQLCE